MQDNDLVTHGLHWLTLSANGWECANPDCDWWLEAIFGYSQDTAQQVFDHDHVKPSEKLLDTHTYLSTERQK